MAARCRRAGWACHAPAAAMVIRAGQRPDSGRGRGVCRGGDDRRQVGHFRHHQPRDARQQPVSPRVDIRHAYGAARRFCFRSDPVWIGPRAACGPADQFQKGRGRRGPDRCGDVFRHCRPGCADRTVVHHGGGDAGGGHARPAGPDLAVGGAGRDGGSGAAARKPDQPRFSDVICRHRGSGRGFWRVGRSARRALYPATLDAAGADAGAVIAGSGHSHRALCGGTFQPDRGLWADREPARRARDGAFGDAGGSYSGHHRALGP